MKIKTSFGLLASVLLVSTASANISVGWANNDGFLYNQLGINQASSANWLFEFVIDQGTATSVSGMISSGQWQIGTGAGNGADTDVNLGQWNNMWSAGNGTVEGPTAGASIIDDSTTLYTMRPFYFRFFNASTEGAATYSGLIYNPAWVTPAQGNLNPYSVELARQADVTTGGATVVGANNGWAANIAVAPIPEPTSLALFGLGGLLVGLRRKFRKA